MYQKTKDKEGIHNIKLLTFPKVLNFGFNPLSVYFCYDNKGFLFILFLKSETLWRYAPLCFTKYKSKKYFSKNN